MLTLYFFGRFIEFSFGSRMLFNLYLSGTLLGATFILAQASHKSQI